MKRILPGGPGRLAALLCLALLSPTLSDVARAQDGPVRLPLAEGGRTDLSIVLRPGHSATEAFAAAELSEYLERLSGAAFPVLEAGAAGRGIVLATGSSAGIGGLSGEAYAITVRGPAIYLTGGSPRAVLFAAYDLLERLGCEFLAPQLDFYAGAAEYVPRRPTLVYEADGDVLEHPVMEFRKIDIEEGLSHDVESVRKIVEWMPKARYNTLQVPTDYNGTGRVTWDAWREAITPEMDRRDLIIEVGGHGYQNFLSAEMEGGALFERHPEWFGKDAECRPSHNDRHVFNTENDEAVEYLIDNVVRYLREHPEIDIFDFWPPDGARWAECREMERFGSAQDRQARLVNRLQARLEREVPHVRLEIIAYAHAKDPPSTVALHPSVLVDFCPIGQEFDVPIYDPSRDNNAIYVDAIRAWRRVFPGDVALYSYYRKYAWRSLPLVIPHYMQRDMQWYASVPLQGISTYAEPGDWGTYELNHFTLARLGWDPDLDVDALVARFARARFGAAHEAATAAFDVLGNEFRLRGTVPYSEPDTPAQLRDALRAVEARLVAVRAVAPAATGPQAAALRRLVLMLEFARRDLRISIARATGADPAGLRPMVEELVALLTANGDAGVFLTREGDLPRYLRHYDVPTS